MKLSLCIHCHQPAGNFDHVIANAWKKCYRPLIETLEKHPSVPVGIHLSGCLTEWLGENQPEFLDLLGELCSKGSLELLSSGYFEPVLPVWKRDDVLRQIREFGILMEGISGRKPSGLWLTERVWEPSLASLIAEAGIEYAVVDDCHLLAGGVSPDDLFRPWITEDSGRSLILLPSSRQLRYMIPFASVDRIRDKLSAWHDAGRELAFYGDDGEKFGVWPGTAELCFERGWLHGFLEMLEDSDWLEVLLPSDAVTATGHSGPVYVPAASYREMGEWTLPAREQVMLGNLTGSLRDAGLLEAAEPFLRGGMWRNFLSRYPESNELHKRVLLASEFVYRSGSDKALRHFWRSQCNCGYWHGVFGGLYLPHLREALWCELHRAEREAHSILGDLPFLHEGDIDADGRPEILVLGGEKSILVRPEMGLTVSELSFVPAEGTPVPLGHVLSRSPEAYHTMPGVSTSGTSTGSIHDQTAKPDGELTGSLRYDSWRRFSFSDIVLPPGVTMEDWQDAGSRIIHFQRNAVRSWEWRRKEDLLTIEALLESGGCSIEKVLEISIPEPLIDVRSEYSFRGSGSFRAGLELCLNLLTGSEPDRRILLDDNPPVPAGSTGSSFEPVRRILVQDLWRDIEVEITPDRPVDVWYSPLVSVSRSEKGYEKVYQGTALYISIHGDCRNSAAIGLNVRLGRSR